jgi:hypothetical protein
MTNSTTNVPSVRIPATVTSDYAYAYGYLTTAFVILADAAANAEKDGNKWNIQRLIEMVKHEAECARLLDAEMSRRADERIKKIMNA